MSGKALMSISLALIAMGMVIQALKWPLKAALFPVVIGIPVFLLAISEFLLSMFWKGKDTHSARGVDFTLSEGIDPATVRSRTLIISSWIIGFVLLVILLGFPIAVPLYFILYLKFAAKEKWGISLVLAASASLFFYGLFVWLLNTPFHDGWVQKGLKALGIIQL